MTEKYNFFSETFFVQVSSIWSWQLLVLEHFIFPAQIRQKRPEKLLGA